MLSDQELGRVQFLIDERARYITRIKGAAITSDPQTRALTLTTLFENLRSTEAELVEAGVMITPFDPRG